MPYLFIPVIGFAGTAFVLGMASLPPNDGRGNQERERTPNECVMARISMICWILAFVFSGWLIATFTPPFRP